MFYTTSSPSYDFGLMVGLGGAAKMPFTTDFEKLDPPVNLDLFKFVATLEVFIRDTTVAFFSFERDSE